jgi:hypothetical protein
VADGRFARAVALTAVAFALGLGSMAAASHLAVERSDIVANAVNGPKVAKNSVTGKDVKEKTLRRVPRAASVNGAAPARFAVDTDHLTDGPERDVLKFRGLILSYDCYRPDESVRIVLNARTTVPNARLTYSITTSGVLPGVSGLWQVNDFDPGPRVTVSEGRSFGVMHLTYTTSKAVVSGIVTLRETSVRCQAEGLLWGGPR